jgi:hypothetical protein
VVPHAAVNLYLAFIVQHPGVFVSKAFVAAKVPYALRDPPGICTAYSAVNPGTSATAVRFAKGALQVFAGVIREGAEGNTTKFFVSEQLVPCAVYVAVKHPAVVGVNTPVAASIVPPPLTVHVPFDGVPV